MPIGRRGFTASAARAARMMQGGIALGPCRSQIISLLLRAGALQQLHDNGDDLGSLRRGIQLGPRRGDVAGLHPNQFGQFALALGRRRIAPDRCTPRRFRFGKTALPGQYPSQQQMGMNVICALGNSAAGGGFSFLFLTQAKTDRGQREFRGAVARRQAHSLTQLALATGKVPQLMQNQAQQAAKGRTIPSIGDGLDQHLPRFTGPSAIQQIPGFVQDAFCRVAGCHLLIFRGFDDGAT